MKITAENRSNVLSVRAKIRKALAVSDVPLTKTDRAALERVVKNLDKALAPKQAAKKAA